MGRPIRSRLTALGHRPPGRDRVAKSTTKIFYVYEHWRPDTAVSFYVGKGKHKRVRERKRNFLHDRVVAKLKAAGLDFEVRIVASNLTEAEAFAMERSRIEYWRSKGVRLCNMTDGGDGSVTVFTPDVLRRIRAARARQVVTEDQKEKHRKIMASPAVREKLSAAAQARTSPNPFAGHKHSEETKRAWSEKRRGRSLTPEHRAKIAASIIARNAQTNA